MAKIKGPKQTYAERQLNASLKKIGVTRRPLPKVKKPK